jgi:hypothetical protein
MDASMDYAQRLDLFVNAGLIKTVPTPWQFTQGTFEMTPYVLSPDITAESFYRPIWGHPWLRQPWLLREIGWDHLATGSALHCQLDSTIAHLHLTWHLGMPVFDLQLIQTHPEGLAYFRQRTEAVAAGSTPLARRHRRIAERIFLNPDAYFEQFLAPNGWIDRAQALDYPTAEEDGCFLPAEFYSLVSFTNYCAAAFARSRESSLTRATPSLLWLGSRRIREARATA